LSDYRDRRVKYLYALLREANIPGTADEIREKRLTLFRWMVHDPTISTTNDLGFHALELVVKMLEDWRRRGELAEQVAQHSN
jgi:hypothetical protein